MTDTGQGSEKPRVSAAATSTAQDVTQMSQGAHGKVETSTDDTQQHLPAQYRNVCQLKEPAPYSKADDTLAQKMPFSILNSLYHRNEVFARLRLYADYASGPMMDENSREQLYRNVGRYGKSEQFSCISHEQSLSTDEIIRKGTKQSPGIA